MNEVARPKLFIVATIFIPTSPLLPTPHMISLPLFSLTTLTHSTARRRPHFAVGSVSYSLETLERAVASVASTCTARLSTSAPSGSSTASGGVTGADIFLLRLREDCGSCGPGEGGEVIAI